MHWNDLFAFNKEMEIEKHVKHFSRKYFFGFDRLFCLVFEIWLYLLVVFQFQFVFVFQ